MNGLEKALSHTGLVEKYSGSRWTDRSGDGESDKGELVAPGQTRQPGVRDFHGERGPNIAILKETPEHRFLLYLFAQGNSTLDVFEQLGGQVDPVTRLPIPGTGKFSYAWLTQIRRQSWFREQLVNFLHETGKDLVRAKLQTELLPSLEVVAQIRDDVNAPSSARLNAANSLIDRFLGKPVQHVITQTPKGVEDYARDASELQKELDQVNEEMKALNAGVSELMQT